VDDTTFILSADPTTIVTVKLILNIFCKLSGLSINFSKSCFVPFKMNSQEIEVVSQLLACTHKDLPLTNLDLPLTVTQPSR
jgi:hypothetical protein